MIWYVVSVLLMVLALSIMGVQFMRDRRTLKRKASEAMSKRLWNEIQEEREASRVRRDRFRAALDEAGGDTKDRNDG